MRCAKRHLDHGSKMRSRRRWWWIALACTMIVLLTTAVSFRWVIEWTNSRTGWYFYVEYGVLHGNNIQVPGVTPLAGPWYGIFRLVRSPIYTPWVLFPSVGRHPSGEWFSFPLHFPLLGLLIAVIYPVLPTTVKRRRRKRGLCVHCEYDLTGNVSGVCPECGTPVSK